MHVVREKSEADDGSSRFERDGGYSVRARTKTKQKIGGQRKRLTSEHPTRYAQNHGRERPHERHELGAPNALFRLREGTRGEGRGRYQKQEQREHEFDPG